MDSDWHVLDYFGAQFGAASCINCTIASSYHDFVSHTLGQANGFQGSGGSVEDLQWSPTEDSVFASCGVDQHLRVWDVRTQREGISVKAHEADINVISWNHKVSYLMISGCDDGSFKIWDLRNFKPCVVPAPL